MPGCEATGFNASNHPVVVVNILGKLELSISDPDMVGELFTTKNSLTDKTGDLDAVVKDLLGESFLFSKGGHIWK